MSLISFLHRYVFRGFGVVLLLGMLTILALAIVSQMRQGMPSGTSTPAPPVGAHKAPERRTP